MESSEVFSALFSQIADLAAQSRGLAVSERLFQPSNIADAPEIALRIIRQHKLDYGIHRVLSNPKYANFVSTEIKQKIRNSAMVESAMKRRLFMDWNMIHAAFVRNRIRVIVIKGPALSVQLYQDAYMRGYTDLDVLVDIQNVCDCVPVMAEAGYKPKESDYVMFCGEASWKENPLVQKPHHLVFIKDDSPYRIEVHTKLYDHLPTKLEELQGVAAVFSRSVLVLDDGTEFPTLSLLDHAMFVVDHGTRHGWCVLHWLLDFAKVLSLDDSQFHRTFIHQMEQTGRARQLVLALNVIREVFDMQIPNTYDSIDNVWKKRLSSQIQYVVMGLAGKRNPGSMSSILKHTYGYKVIMSSSVLELTHALVGLLLISPQDIARFPVPKILLPFHLILRPLFVVSRRFKRYKENRNT